MEYKYIKVNFEKFKIEYNGTQFRDIDEFVSDLRNIFSQMHDIYKVFSKKADSIMDEKELQKLSESICMKLKHLQDELQGKLNYITDSNKVSQDLVNKARPKLMQLKSLNESIDIFKDTRSNLNRLVNFYFNRVLEQNLINTHKVYSHKGTLKNHHFT